MSHSEDSSSWRLCRDRVRPEMGTGTEPSLLDDETTLEEFRLTAVATPTSVPDTGQVLGRQGALAARRSVETRRFQVKLQSPLLPQYLGRVRSTRGRPRESSRRGQPTAGAAFRRQAK
jgi:hypothetical protein